MHCASPGCRDCIRILEFGVGCTQNSYWGVMNDDYIAASRLQNNQHLHVTFEFNSCAELREKNGKEGPSNVLPGCL